MGYAELILALEQLPEEKQVEVLDFAKFLAQQAECKQVQPKTLAESALGQWIKNPVGVTNFVPLSREEANAR